MASSLSDAELNHILSNREPYADATDLITIRDEKAALEAHLAKLEANSLKRMVNRTEIAAVKTRLGRLGTAEINAREHVRASPIKTRIYETEIRQRAEAATLQAPSEPRPSGTSSKARQAWLAQETADRKKVPTLAGDDEA